MRNLYLLGAALLLATACKEEKKESPGMGQGGRPQGPSPTFNAIIAESYPINRSIEAPGTILPNETTDMQPEISGRVVSINFKEGSFVKAGTLLVKLFDADLQAQLRKLDVQLDIAEATAKRQKELLAINGTSQQDYDNAVLNVSNIKADMDLLKVRIAQTEVRAPFDGKLGLRNISLGAYVTPATIITNISQLNTIKVEFTVPEKYAPEMIPGKTVTIATADRNKMYAATVIASQNLISTDTRNLLLRAVVKNPDTYLTPGVFVQVKIGVGQNESAIMIPTQAVIPSTRDKRIIVLRDGKAVFQTINTGFRDSAKVEISGGIRPGDTIVTTGLLSIKEGMPVIVKISQP
ncbi:MAG: efflux RND transporter periplasmic adaptor subunit [Chitinophagaceae bacterium]|nr:efflux RND transporter periplasmic adaptor subunit [Chitinophagaceae bacterium]MCU0404405.1 efflux RND transporter periplasmic adaptor subunit [Chitinophagaceae bacterium]